MKKIQKKISLLAVALVASLCVSFVSTAQENAEEKSQENYTMSIVETVNALAEPKEGAAVVKELKEGDTVVVTEKVSEEWSQILLDGKAAYVSTSKITEPPVNEALVKEMEEMASKEAVEIEAFERQRKEAIRARIWGIVIAVLIIGIFALGIISTMKASKDTEAEKRKKDLMVMELEEENVANKPEK